MQLKEFILVNCHGILVLLELGDVAASHEAISIDIMLCGQQHIIRISLVVINPLRVA